MEKSKVYFTNFRARPGYNLLQKLDKLSRKAGIENIDFKNKYVIWSSYRPEDDGVLVAYASIHGNTAKAAKKMAQILEQKGAKKVVITDLSRDDMAEAIEDAFRYDKIIFAASTYNATVFPVMASFLRQLAGKNYQNKKVGIIENGTWAPAAAKAMLDIISTMKNIDVCENILTIKSVLNENSREQMNKLATEILSK